MPAGYDVLLIEDEPMILMFASLVLCDAGYRVRECTSAEEAVDALKQGYRPDIVVADHTLPGMSGSDFVLLVQKGLYADVETWSPAIIIASGDAVRVAPNFIVLEKPYREDQLIDRVSALLILSED